MNIVDSLIVTLGLDTRKFDAAQKRTTDSLGKMKTESNASAKSVGEHWTKAQAILAAVGGPVETAQKHLRDLSSQAGRTGGAVRAGALAGTDALMAMGAAAAEALAPLALLYKLAKMTLKDAPATANVARAAANMGVPTPWLSSYTQAAKITADANPAAVTSELGSFNQALVNARLTSAGAHSPVMIALGRLGIQTQDANRNPVPLSAIMPQIQAKLHGMSGPDRTKWANQLGLSSLNNVFAAATEAQFAHTMAETRLTAETNQQAKAAKQLTMEENKLSVAVDNLTRIVELDLTPGLIRLVSWLTGIVGDGAKPAKPIHTLPSWVTGKPLADAALADHAARAKTSAEVQARQSAMMQQLQAAGWSPAAAAAWTGNAMAESTMNPRAANGDHTGLWGLSPQWRAKIKALTGIDMNTAGQADQVRGLTAAIQKYEPALYARLKHEGPGVAATDILNTFEKPYTGAREYIEGIRRSVYAYRAAALPSGGARVANAPWLPGFHTSLRAATIGAGVHHHRHQTQVHVGGVTVHAKSADARGIGHETAQAIKRQFLAAQANRGLS